MMTVTVIKTRRENLGKMKKVRETKKRKNEKKRVGIGIECGNVPILVLR